MSSKTTILDKVESVLYSGASFTNSGNSNDSESSTYSTNYSPNNLKSVILSPEGLVLVFHTTSSNQNKLIRRINFPQTTDTLAYLSEDKEILSFLVGKRVYSSLEEIIIIAQSGYEPMFKLPKRQLTFVQTQVIPRLKRLRDVIVIPNIPTPLEDFQNYYEDKLKQDNTTLAQDPQLASQQGVSIIPIHENWYSAINLRPSYYKIDEKGGVLHQKFLKAKEIYGNGSESAITEELVTQTDDSSSPSDKVRDLTPQDLTDLEQINMLFGLYYSLSTEQNITDYNINKFINEVTPEHAGGTKQVIDFLSTSYNFKPFNIPYYIEDDMVEQNPNLKSYQDFLNLNGTQSKSLRPSQFKDLKQLMNDGFVNQLKKIYYAHKKSTSSKTHELLNIELHSGFIRLYKTPHYQDLYTSLKTRSSQITRPYINQLKDLLQFPFYKGLINTLPVPYTDSKNTDPVTTALSSIKDEEDLHLILISILFGISRGFKLTQQQDQSTLEITHDWLNKKFSLGKGYFDLALTQTDPDKQKRISFKPETIWAKLEDMVSSSGLNKSDTTGVYSTSDMENSTLTTPTPEKSDLDVPEVQSELHQPQPPAEEMYLDDLEDIIQETTPNLTDQEAELLQQEQINQDLDLEKSIDDKIDKDSDNLNYEFKPDKAVRTYLTWLDKLLTAFNEPHNPAVDILKPVLYNFSQEVKDTIEGSEVDSFDKDLEQYLIDTLMETLSQVQDRRLKVYLNMKQVYFNRLKTVNNLNSNVTTFNNGFEHYYSIRGTQPSSDHTHEYLKSLYYIIRGRIRK